MADFALHPPDDTGCTLTGLVATPTGAGPWPAVLIIHGGSFVHHPTSAAANGCWQEMAQNGFLSVYIEYRLVELPGGNNQAPAGQTTSGTYPQQSQDVAQWVAAVRADPRCNGKVYGIGGSAGGTWVVQACGDGTVGDDRMDGGVSMSGAFDFGDADSRSISSDFADFVDNYALSSDLSVLTARSPVSFVDVHTSPLRLWQGDNEPMPAPQMDLLSAKLTSLGLSNFATTRFTGTQGTVHSFANWSAMSVPAIAFLTALANDATPPPPPPPPPPPGPSAGELTDYTWSLSGPGVATSGTVSGVITGDAISAQITGLDPLRAYTFTLTANNAVGASPPAVATFTSDPGGGGGGGIPGRKFAPKGVYGYVNNLSTFLAEGMWDDAYIDGVRLDIGWDDIQPTNGTTYDWSVLDSLLAQCQTKSKKCGICVIAGTSTPAWVYTAGAHSYTSSGTFPLPWDTIFLGKWIAFITALATRYESNSFLAYVAMTGYGRAETTAIALSTGDRNGLETLAIADGFAILQDGLESGTASIVAAYLASFLITPILLTLDTPFPDGSGNDGDNYLETIIANAYGNGMVKPTRLLGLMTEDLTAVSNTPPYSQAVAALKLKVGTVNNDPRPYGMRFKYDSDNPLLDPTQTDYDEETGFINAGNAAVAIRVKFVELFPSDIDKTTPFPTDIANLAATLKGAV